MSKSLIIKENLIKKLKQKKISQRKLCKFIDYNWGNFSQAISGKRNFPEDTIEKLAGFFEISPDEIKGWILADKYSREILQRAIELKPLGEDEKLIFTIKTDEALQKKNLSRTAFAGLIGYSQGSVNEMIIGKKPASKRILYGISKILEVQQDEVKSWLVADKYSLNILNIALSSGF